MIPQILALLTGLEAMTKNLHAKVWGSAHVWLVTVTAQGGIEVKVFR